MYTIYKYLNQSIGIAPLATFRVLFGVMMLFSVIRFALNGWIYDLYIKPEFLFPYFGFEWLPRPSEFMLYGLFGIMAVSALFIALGFIYRVASISFFLAFTYIGFLDKTNYLNHYYFVSLIAFLLIFLPANRIYSVDVWLKPNIKVSHVPRWTVGILRFQVGLVYLMAGIAKLNYDWLFRAMPLKTWLAARTDLPLIGWLFDYSFAPFVFSWAGAAFDLFIVFFMLNKNTQKWGYVVIVIFHLLTSYLFNIGVFPIVMITSALIFFLAETHQKWWNYFGSIFRLNKCIEVIHYQENKASKVLNFLLLSVYLIIQVIMPFRYVFYPGNLFWTEQGYRFSWRVMLMEKGGAATFHVIERNTGKSIEVTNTDFLTPYQEKMMATQPDMILQFAHYLKKEYENRGMTNPKITTDCYVALNGRASRKLIDSTIDIGNEEDGFSHKTWILN